MEQEELVRVRKYHNLIAGSGGRLDVLTREEQDDLAQLLEKSQAEQRCCPSQGANPGGTVRKGEE